VSRIFIYLLIILQEELEILNTLKPKEEKDDSSSTNPDGSIKVKTENDDGNLKHTEDSTALKNAILGPQPAESEQPPTVATEGIPTVHSTKTENVSSGKLFVLFLNIYSSDILKDHLHANLR
jgi:hypothetical protein